MRNLEVRIVTNYLENTVDVILFSDNEENGNRTIVNYDSDKELLIATTYKYGEASMLEKKPFLKLNHSEFNLFANAFVEYSKVNNIKTKEQSLTEGKLEVTEKQVKFLEENLIKFIDKATK